MPLRILYAAFDVVPSPKGASRHITAFTRALVGAGHEVTLFTVGLPELPAAGAWAGARMLRAHSPEDNFLRRALHFGDAVWEHLREQGEAYDLVHFRDIWSGQAALQARQEFRHPYRTLFEANGLPSVELKYHYQTLAGTDLPGRFRGQEQAILRRVDGVVCVSGVTAIYLRSLGAPPGVITVIPNGVDPALFPPVEGMSVGQPKLVYAGTLASWQGVSTAIEAMPTILAAFPEAELHLIGPSKKRHQKGLVKLVAKLGLDEEDVRFAGPVDPEEMPARLAAASVCLAPLAYNDRNVAQGCCPIKVLEYAAAARPIVASDLPVVRELLGEGEVRFCQPGDAAGLARQVIHLLSHPEQAQAMARRAAEKVTQTFTWQRSGEGLLEVYAQLMETGAPDTEPATPLALAPQ
jgi:glycosyltransferase involved in cell wall biosynthesis